MESIMMFRDPPKLEKDNVPRFKYVIKHEAGKIL